MPRGEVQEVSNLGRIPYQREPVHRWAMIGKPSGI